MIRAAVAGLAKLVLLLAGAALLTAVSLFVVGAWLSTWPLLRLSPRNAKIRAAMELAVSVAAIVAVMKPELAELELEPEPAESAPNDA